MKNYFAPMLAAMPFSNPPVDGYLSYAIVVNMKVGGTLGNDDSIVVESSAPAVAKRARAVPFGLLALDRCAHLNVLAYLQPNWLEELLEWVKHTGDFSDESEIYGQKRFEPRYPTSKEDLLALTALRLNGCNLSGQIPKSLGNCTKLTHLWLDGNQLTGQIPESIGNCKELKKLNLAENQLEGEIPVSLGNCANLKYLYLERNKLTGPIPSSLENCVNLTHLYLYRNQLTGAIPVSLGNCIKLEWLDLSYNNLEDPAGAKAALAMRLPKCSISV